jgi:hypothetical protein
MKGWSLHTGPKFCSWWGLGESDCRTVSHLGRVFGRLGHRVASATGGDVASSGASHTCRACLDCASEVHCYSRRWHCYLLGSTVTLRRETSGVIRREKKNIPRYIYI